MSSKEVCKKLENYSKVYIDLVCVCMYVCVHVCVCVHTHTCSEKWVLQPRAEEEAGNKNHFRQENRVLIPPTLQVCPFWAVPSPSTQMTLNTLPRSSTPNSANPGIPKLQ